MTTAFQAIYDAVQAGDPDLLEVVRNNWADLLGPDEKKLVGVLIQGSKPTMSEVQVWVSTQGFGNANLDDCWQVGSGAAPTSSTSPGSTRCILVTPDYIYICTGTNQWRRADLTIF